jgi:ribonuclease J
MNKKSNKKSPLLKPLPQTKPLPQKELLFLPLGGCGEIGMNLNLYSYNGKWLMVDLGVTFTNELGIEIMMPDPKYIVERRRDLVGLVLTHAHEDHIGAVPYLWEYLRCPIYATPFTAHLVRDKLKEVGLAKHAVVHQVPLGEAVTLDPFHVQFVTITHSIPEPNVLAIKTPAGTVIHTGDWKIDNDPLIGDSTDIAKLKALGDEGVLALVCDSTNVFVKGRTGSEAIVRKELIKLVQKQKQRVVVACFASNVARLASAAIAAEESGRHVVLVGRSLYRIEEAARTCGYLKGLKPFLHENDMKSLPPEKLLLICTGSQGEPRAALARIAARQHPRVKLEAGDTVIFSSRVIPGNERDIYHLQEQLYEQGIIVINEQEEDVHVSGHPAREDLKLMYQWIRPQIIVPVHGERAHLREHVRFALKCGVPQAIQAYNGTLVALNPDNPGIVEEVHAGRLALDGQVLIPFRNIQLRDRHRLMESGVIMATIMRTRKGQIKQAPILSLLGVVEEGAEESTIQQLQQQLLDTFAQTPSDIIRDNHAIQELTRLTIRRIINAIRGKKPVVVVHVLEI